jgi:hypothetical protein
VEVQFHTFFTSALDGGGRLASRPGRFTPRERAPGTHCIGGWVGLRAGLDTVVKKKFLASTDTRTHNHPARSQCYTAELSWLLRLKQRRRNYTDFSFQDESGHIKNKSSYNDILTYVLIMSSKENVDQYTRCEHWT